MSGSDAGQQHGPESVALPEPVAWAGLVSRPWKALPADADLLSMLTAATCPAPCEEREGPNEWHAQCSARAERALDVLRGWVGTERRA